MMMSNHIYSFIWNVITHPCPNFNGSLTKSPLKLRHVWVITSHFYVGVITCPYHYPDCLANDVRECPLVLLVWAYERIAVQLAYQNVCLFADGIFKSIYLDYIICILNQISLKFVPKGTIKTHTTIGPRNNLTLHMVQAIIRSNGHSFHRSIYASPTFANQIELIQGEGLPELHHFPIFLV